MPIPPRARIPFVGAALDQNPSVDINPNASSFSGAHISTPHTVGIVLSPPVTVAPPEVINLDGFSEGGTGSPGPNITQPTVVAAVKTSTVDTVSVTVTTKPSSLGHASRVVGSTSRLDYLSVTFPGIQSHWHVNRKAKDLAGVYSHDADLMGKVGVSRCLDMGVVMLGRCLAIMQYYRAAAERQSDL